MRQVLIGPLAEYVRRLQQNGHAVHVVKDNAPVHTARTVKFVGNLGQLPTHFHPPRSPNLNSIKNCWAVLKKHFHALAHYRADEVWQEIQCLWDVMDYEGVLQ